MSEKLTIGKILADYGYTADDLERDLLRYMIEWREKHQPTAEQIAERFWMQYRQPDDTGYYDEQLFALDLIRFTIEQLAQK